VQIITLDFETFFDSESFTLKKMTTEGYVRDPRFKAHGAGIRWPRTGTATWYPHDILVEVFEDMDWSNTAVLAHHAHFDGLILNHTYGKRPQFWFDTYSMARLLHGHLPKGLDALARLYGRRGKTINYDWFDGLEWNEITSDVQALIGEGCCDDVMATWEIFVEMAKVFPRGEYELVDMTVRMFTEPFLIGDVDLLADVWREENGKKHDLMAELGVTPAQLQSSDQFKALLEAEGVEICYKQGIKGLIPAFAKNDEFMRELQNDDDERVAGLVAARLGAKSTAIQSRAETLGFMASRGPLCIYLYYCGATVTTRWSGGDDANFQNLKRGHRIRNALRVPAGYKFAAPDASQIECRFLNRIAGQTDIVDKFRRGDDIYSELASQFYGRPISKATPDERGTGKQGELSCGYGCGGSKFKLVAALGTYGPRVAISLEEATRFVDLYRATHPNVRGLWREGETVLVYLAGGLEMTWRDIFHIKDKRIYGPTGVPMDYTTLRVSEETGEWQVRTRKGWQKMYGAKLVENVIQYIARIHIAECMKTIRREGLRIVGMSHDEIWVPLADGEHQADDLQFCLDAIKSPPAWMPDVPLDAECTKLEQFYAK
jgi:DNA polymerase family A